jgi:hypothetical protein
MKNEIMLKRLCSIVAQTYAVPLEKILQEAKEFGIDAVVRNLELAEQNTPKFN